MTTITAFNKARNTTYVYESDSHWDKDKDKQQSRSKRRLIGKIDPKTGNVIPTAPVAAKNLGARRKLQLLQLPSRNRTTSSSTNRRHRTLKSKMPKLLNREERLLDSNCNSSGLSKQSSKFVLL